MVLLLKIKVRFWNDYNPIYEGNRGSQIVKTFKKELEQHFRDLVNGKAMSVWIAEKTVTEAKSLLQDGAVPIKEVAYRLGFAESTHFSAFFKKHMKVSPVDYRKQQG